MKDNIIDIIGSKVTDGIVSILSILRSILSTLSIRESMRGMIAMYRIGLERGEEVISIFIYLLRNSPTKRLLLSFLLFHESVLFIKHWKQATHLFRKVNIVVRNILIRIVSIILTRTERFISNLYSTEVQRSILVLIYTLSIILFGTTFKTFRAKCYVGYGYDIY